MPHGHRHDRLVAFVARSHPWAKRRRIDLADLTMLYATFPNGGMAAPLKVTDAPAAAPMRLMGSAAAWYVTDILRGSPLPEGFAQGLGLARPRDIAFKTGTSYGFRDAWAVGYSPTYTVGIWIGRADGSPQRVEQGGSRAREASAGGQAQDLDDSALGDGCREEWHRGVSLGEVGDLPQLEPEAGVGFVDAVAR